MVIKEEEQEEKEVNRTRKIKDKFCNGTQIGEEEGKEEEKERKKLQRKKQSSYTPA